MSQHVLNFSLSLYSITQSFTTLNLFTLYLLPTHHLYTCTHSTLSCSFRLCLAIHKILNMDVENLRCRSVICLLCPCAHPITSIHIICPPHHSTICVPPTTSHLTWSCHPTQGHIQPIHCCHHLLSHHTWGQAMTLAPS